MFKVYTKPEDYPKFKKGDLACIGITGNNIGLITEVKIDNAYAVQLFTINSYRTKLIDKGLDESVHVSRLITTRSKLFRSGEVKRVLSLWFRTNRHLYPVLQNLISVKCIMTNSDLEDIEISLLTA